MEQRPPHFDAIPPTEVTSEKVTTKKKRRVMLPSGVVPPVEKLESAPAPSPPEPVAEKPAESIKPLFERKNAAEESNAEQDDTDEAKESDAALENLDKEESQQAVQEYIEAVLPQVVEEAERAEPESRMAVEAAADEALLRELQARLPEAASAAAALDGAYETVANTLEDGETTADEAPEVSGELEASAEQAAEDTDEEPEDPAAAAASMPSPSRTSSTQAPMPVPGAVPPANLPPIPPAGGRAFTPSPAGGHNNMPSMSLADLAATGYMPMHEAHNRARGAQASGLIVGGLIGYFIGRRRGRIKTEKKLVPIQKKLEKQVKELHQDVAIKQERIRTLAAQKAEAATELDKNQETVKKLREKHTKVSAAEAVATVAGVTAAAELARPKPLPTAEQAPASRPVLQMETAHVTTRQVEQMAMPQVLVMAENIKVDNVSVRQMYESRQLDEQSVRRIVVEQVRGGNPHEAVARELIAKETPFERDPHTRAQVASPLGGGAGADSAMPVAPGSSDTLPSPVASSFTQNNLQAQQKVSPNRGQSHTATIGIAVIITIALALAIGAILI